MVHIRQYNASPRASHGWSLLPARCQAIIDNASPRCSHDKDRRFSILLGKEPQGNIKAYTDECARCRYQTIVHLNCEEREQWRAGMAVYDAEQAQLKPRAAAGKKATPKSRKKVVSTSSLEEPSRESNAKGKAKKRVTPPRKNRKKAVEVPSSSPVAMTTPEAKRNGKQVVTPPRKKARRESTNVSPVVQSDTAVAPKVGQFVDVYLFMEAGKEPVMATDEVLDISRFEFARHKAFALSNAVPAPENDFKATVYVRYSPHLGDFKDPEGSRVFGKTNLSESGDTVIYRAEGLKDHECPGLEKLKMEVQMLSSSGSPDYPSFTSPEAVAGPSTRKRSYQAIVDESDQDTDWSGEESDD
ncbi:hypothetical protein C8F04DRAFT_1258527 [Mycena alexandri]|uniref:Uncharacterized protein n=1 Tax=Mycena alexandri TaxID=1745969 RepID=A0AAD6SYB0_9AGAR|nr:hypothetical protein C8F04DRAFT_1258527 [Mycena alexandri]